MKTWIAAPAVFGLSLWMGPVLAQQSLPQTVEQLVQDVAQLQRSSSSLDSDSFGLCLESGGNLRMA